MLTNLFSVVKKPPPRYFDRAQSVLGYLYASPYDYELVEFISFIFKEFIKLSVEQDLLSGRFQLTNIAKQTRPDKSLALSHRIALRQMEIREHPLFGKAYNDHDWQVVRPSEAILIKNNDFIMSGDMFDVLDYIITT